MRIDLKEKIRYFYPRKDYEFAMKPDRDWVVMFFVFISIFVIVVVLNIYFSNFVFNQDKREDLVTEEEIFINKNEFEKALQTIAERESRFNKLLEEKPVFADPAPPEGNTRKRGRVKQF